MLGQDEMLGEHKERSADDAGYARGNDPSGKDLRGTIDSPVDLLDAH